MKHKIELNKWMSLLGNGKKINELNIPGSHDSGTYAPDSYFNFITKKFSMCQDMTIREQLDNGIRFLDIRLKNKDGCLKVFHGIVEENLNFEEILKTLRKFLSRNKEEFVFLRVEKTEDNNNFEEVFFDLLKLYGDIISKPRSLKSKISILRGKIIFLQTKTIESKGIKYGIPYNFFKIQDFYDLNSEDRTIEWKFKKIKKSYKACSKKENTHPCLNYTSGSSSNTKDILSGFIFSKNSLTPRNISSEINKRNLELLDKVEEKTYYGFIIMDFPTRELIKSIVRTNFLK